MSTEFTIGYQLRTNELSVRYNGVDQMTNSFSPFINFKGQPFARWFTELSRACHEVSGTDQYTVSFHGDEISADILRAVLGERLRARAVPALLITLKHRLNWARELSAATGRVLSLQPLRVWNAAGGNIGCPAITLAGCVDVRVKEVTGVQQADVVLVDSQATFDQLAQQATPGNAVCLFICPGNAWNVEKTAPGCCLAQCPAAELPERLCRWYEAVQLPGQFAAYQAALPASKLTPLQKEKRLRLTLDKPYLHMTLPGRVKVGDSFKKPRVDKLPEDMKASMIPDANYVSVQKKGDEYWLTPTREGRFTIAIVPDGFPGERVNFSMEAYQLHPVTSIRLSASRNRVMPGDSFSVSASYSPSNADNTSRARWTIASGASCVRMNAPGQFVACSAGRCTIVHEVEGVRESVSVDVMQAATGMRLSANRISVKLNDCSKQLAVTVNPPGAQGYRVTYTVQDASVLQVDSRNGQITPVDEGVTTINVCLFDSRGSLIRSDSCSVEVLPLHAVVNPDIATIMAIVLVLLQGLFMPAPIAGVIMIAAIAAAVVGIVRNKQMLVWAINCVAILLALFIQFGGS